MLPMQANIVSKEKLANGFTQVTLESDLFEHILPGHSFMLNDVVSSHAMKSGTAQAQFLIPPGVSFSTSTISISEPKGTVLPPPSEFTLLVVDVKSLYACLFYLKQHRKHFKGIVFIGTENVFPFYPAPSRQMIPTLSGDIIASLPLLEDWGIPNRLASKVDMPGCFLGTHEELADNWLTRWVSVMPFSPYISLHF